MEEYQVIPRVKELFESTCVKQFESMGCYIAEKSEGDTAITNVDSLKTATINAGSSDMEVALYLSMSENFLEHSMPPIEGLGYEPAHFQMDWCLELANRFLGRLKNKLISHECILRMGLPSIYEGKVDQLSFEKDTASSTWLKWCFHISHETNRHISLEHIVCQLEVKLLNPSLRLGDYEDEDEDWFEESELEHL